MHLCRNDAPAIGGGRGERGGRLVKCYKYWCVKEHKCTVLAYVQRCVSTRLCVCVCVGGVGGSLMVNGGGNLLRAVADVSVSSDHSARSACEAPTLHKGVCKKEHGLGCFAQRSRIRAMRKNVPRNPKRPLSYFIFSFASLCCALKCATTSL